jgi:prepilin-type N-terminal cleavage/methylation domain-containing protein
MTPRAKARNSSDDRGDSLIEVLIALSILSIGVTALMFGLGTNITTSVTNRIQSEGVTALESAAEYVKSLDQATICATTTQTSVPASEVVAPTGATISFGPVTTVGSEACSAIAAIPVQVAGNGFQTIHVTVVTRG